MCVCACVHVRGREGGRTCVHVRGREGERVCMCVGGKQGERAVYLPVHVRE